MPSGRRRQVLEALAVSQGLNVPSARFRVRAYVRPLVGHGIRLTEWTPSISSYPPASRWFRPCWAAAALVERIAALAKAPKHDVVIVQREMISTFYTLERFLPRPWVLDVDDAIYLHRGGSAARAIASRADAVICGNDD